MNQNDNYSDYNAAHIEVDVADQALRRRQDIRTRDCLDMINESYQEMTMLNDVLLQQMLQQGWEPPSQFMPLQRGLK
jgi:hypothetical protein